MATKEKLKSIVKGAKLLNTSKLNKTEKINFMNMSGQKSLVKGILNKTGIRPTTASKKKTVKENVKNDDGSDIENEEAEKVGELGEVLTSNQKAMNLIDDTIDILENDKIEGGKIKSNERYVLKDKEWFSKLKVDNEKLRAEKKQLFDEYQKLKDTCAKVEHELATLNYNYFQVEQTKAKSITKLYDIEEELKNLLIDNCKLTEEISFEFQEKNNVFRALFELQNKYNVKFPQELEETLKNVKSKIAEDGTALKINNQDKLAYLEDEVERLENEIKEKNKVIEELTKKQQQH